MALTSTLYTGLTGMSVNQQKLNVIGNNIANVNTVAFKSSRALFKPQFYVTDAAGSPPTGEFGGTNPSQRGLGAQVAAIQKNFNPGSIENTGIGTDLAIEGDGFFIVDGGKTAYTRDGSFSVNEDNYLVSSKGEYVQGFGVDKDFNVIPGVLQNLEIPVNNLTIAEATTKVEFKGNLNAAGDKSTGASVLESQPLLVDDGTSPAATTPLLNLRRADDLTAAIFADGQTLSVGGKRGGNNLPESTFKIDASTTIADLNAFFKQGLAIDDSSEVLAAAPAGFTPGVALAASTVPTDPAGSLRLLITGNAGKANSLAIDGSFKTDAGTVPFTFSEAANSDPTGEGLHTSMTVYDSLGTPVNVDVTLTLESSDSTGTKWRFYASSKDDTHTGAFDPTDPEDNGMILNSGTVEFDNQGVFKGSANDVISVARANTGASTPLPIKLDLSKLTSLTSTTQQVVPERQDGFRTGTLADFSIADNGDIVGEFDNGLTRTLGRVAIAHFDNPSGLLDQGSNNYTASASSGEAVVATPGDFSAGLIRSGSLEQSNVDLSKEFIDMIVTTTGFSAASRVITTSNRLLDELLQTSR